MKVRSARWEKIPPAAEWRKITYDVKIPKNRQFEFGYSRIQSALRERDQHDSGAGATLAAGWKIVASSL